MNEHNCFITLTYNDENLPDTGSLDKRHLQLFFKRLRRRIEPTKIRYYACGEYGDKLNRPHYHACIFGYDFPDKEMVEYSKRNNSSYKPKSGPDNSVYNSPQLDKTWKKGFTTLGQVTFESAGYVARYVAKKITGEMAEDHYQGKTPEFALMSRNPGLGTPWFNKFKGDIYPKDFFTLRGRKMQPPLYYDNKLKQENYDQFLEIKERRIQQTDLDKARNGKRLWQKDKYRKAVTKTLERRIHND